MKRIRRINESDYLSKILTKDKIMDIFQELSDDGCTINIKENKYNFNNGIYNRLHKIYVYLIFKDKFFKDNRTSMDYKNNFDLLKKANNILSDVINCLTRIDGYRILYGVNDHIITIELTNEFIIPDSWFIKE